MLKQELQQFSTKVDAIVAYLTVKRQEKRYEENKIDLNLVKLRTNTYEQTKYKDQVKKAVMA
jgi:hypothetical protein